MLGNSVVKIGECTLQVSRRERTSGSSFYTNTHMHACMHVYVNTIHDNHKKIRRHVDTYMYTPVTTSDVSYKHNLLQCTYSCSAPLLKLFLF